MSEHKRSAPRILVVDDDPSIRQLVSTIVRRERYTVDCAVDGVEAIELLKKNEYSVILLDLMMPRVDGFGVVNFLKEHPRPNKPIVLVITAYADQRFKEVDSTVVAGVIRKPFEVADIGEIVRLCVSGFHHELSQRLYVSSDRAIRDFARARPANEEDHNDS